MILFEGIVTLLFGALIGGILAFKFGCWFTHRSLGTKSYSDLQRDHNMLNALVKTSIESAEAQYVHHRCDARPVKAEEKKDDQWDDFIAG